MILILCSCYIIFCSNYFFYFTSFCFICFFLISYYRFNFVYISCNIHHCTLFYFIIFYLSLLISFFHFTSFYFISFHFIYGVLLYFILFHFILASFFLSFVLFFFILFYFLVFHFILFHSFLCYFIILYFLILCYVSTLCCSFPVVKCFECIIPKACTCDCTMSDRSQQSIIVQSNVLYNYWPSAEVTLCSSKEFVVPTIALHCLVKRHVVHSPMKCGSRDCHRRSLIGQVNTSPQVPSPSQCVLHQSMSKALVYANALLID